MKTHAATPLIDRSISGHFITVPAQTIALVAKETSPYLIINIWIKLGAGTCTVAIKINGTAVTSLSAISVTTTGQTVVATGANSVVVGDRVEMTISSPSGASDLEWTLKAIG